MDRKGDRPTPQSAVQSGDGIRRLMVQSAPGHHEAIVESDRRTGRSIGAVDRLMLRDVPIMLGGNKLMRRGE